MTSNDTPSRSYILAEVRRARGGNGAPQTRRLGVARLLFAKPRARLPGETLVVFGGGGGVILHVEPIERRQVALVPLAPPALQRRDELPELRAPVPHVVDPHHLEALRLQDPVETRADDRRAQMPDVKRLGDVGRGVVDDDRAPGPARGVPEVATRGVVEDRLGEERGPDAEVDVGTGGADRGEGRELGSETAGEVAGDLGWGFALELGETSRNAQHQHIFLVRRRPAREDGNAEGPAFGDSVLS